MAATEKHVEGVLSVRATSDPRKLPLDPDPPF